VAELLDVHESTVYKDIDAGRLRALRVGGKRGTLRILPVDFDAYLANMATAGSAVAS
jgi:excisionase family DNA binding protein